MGADVKKLAIIAYLVHSPVHEHVSIAWAEVLTGASTTAI